jgi:small nuclear ribonucleoprotein
MEQSRPFDFLNKSVNKNVLVVMKGGITVRGILKAFDVHMNIILENAEKLTDGNPDVKYGSTIIRGDTVILISL